MMQPAINFLLDYLFPPVCLNCSDRVINQGSFCSKCWLEIDFISKPYCKICGAIFNISHLENLICSRCVKASPDFDQARSIIKFNYKSKKLVHAFKYFDRFEIAKLFAKLIWYRYASEDIMSNIDYIIPVPMNRFKRIFRRYNQAQILAKEISHLLKKPMLNDLLIKLKWTKSQTFLSKKKRETNLIGSIEFNKEYYSKLQGKNILLVDDVMTTGATIQYCSKVLKKAGAVRVNVITIAIT